MKFRVSLGLCLAAALGACAVQNDPAPVMRWGNGAPTPTVVVQNGDTLSLIANRYGLDYREIAAANRIAPPYRIYAGERLSLPGTPQPARPVMARAAPMAPAPTTPPSPPHALPAPSAPPHPIELAEAMPPPPSAPASLRIESPELPPLDHPLGSPPPSLRRVRVAAAPVPKPKPKPVRVAMREPAPPPRRPEASPPPAPRVIHAVGRHGFIWPVAGHIVEGFGPGPHGTRNDGINIAARRGTPVLAAASGTVVYCGNQVRGYGNLILLRHEGGYLTAYAHNEALLVRKGQHVTRGQIAIGGPGASTGASVE
ncbi:MAG: peptidoglycan DD-metalloendopeptidase family protein, partial [Stellaceae bacterium]